MWRSLDCMQSTHPMPQVRVRKWPSSKRHPPRFFCLPQRRQWDGCESNIGPNASLTSLPISSTVVSYQQRSSTSRSIFLLALLWYRRKGRMIPARLIFIMVVFDRLVAAGPTPADPSGLWEVSPVHLTTPYLTLRGPPTAFNLPWEGTVLGTDISTCQSHWCD